jgi:hypothetical protein
MRQMPHETFGLPLAQRAHHVWCRLDIASGRVAGELAFRQPPSP